MTSNLIRLALGLAVVTFGFLPFEHATAQSAPAGTREAPARLLPVPDTVSPQMQAIIARPFDPAYNAVPQTIAEWKKRVEDGARRVEATLPKIREALGVTVEPTILGGVRCFMVTPKSIPPSNRNRVLLHFHSGAVAEFLTLARQEPWRQS